MTTAEAAAALSLRPVTLRAHIKAGLIAATRHGRDWWIDPAEVERYREDRRPAGRPKEANK